MPHIYRVLDGFIMINMVWKIPLKYAHIFMAQPTEKFYFLNLQNFIFSKADYKEFIRNICKNSTCLPYSITDLGHHGTIRYVELWYQYQSLNIFIFSRPSLHIVLWSTCTRCTHARASAETVMTKLLSQVTINTLSSRQNGLNFADNIFKIISLNENVLNF